MTATYLPPAAFSTLHTYKDPEVVASQVQLKPMTFQELNRLPATSPWSLAGRKWVLDELHGHIKAGVRYINDRHADDRRALQLTSAMQQIIACRIAQLNLMLLDPDDETQPLIDKLDVQLHSAKRVYEGVLWEANEEARGKRLAEEAAGHDRELIVASARRLLASEL